MMKCEQSCRLFGMYQFLSGIEDNVVLIHSVVGCHFATLMHSIHKNQKIFNSCSTVINDKDVIFGGEQSLTYAIEQVVDLYQPQSITVLTGCVSEIIKDDIQTVIESFKSIDGFENIAISHFEGTGFMSNFDQGYEDALFQYTKEFAGLAASKQQIGNSINILGTLKDDYKLEEDVAEIKAIIEPKVKINCVTGCCKLKDLADMPKASLNVVFGRGIEAAVYMEEQFGIPYIVLDFPYGIAKSQEFLAALEQHFNVDFSQEKLDLENYVLDALGKVYGFLREFYGIYVGLYVSSARFTGLNHFLCQELGMNVVAADKSKCAYEDFVGQFNHISPAILFASSFEGGIANDFQAPLFPVEYPVINRVSIAKQPYVMGVGAVNFVNDLINMLMILKHSEDKGAMCCEKNMYLR